MNIIERLTEHYQAQPPRLSFGGSEGSAVRIQVFDRWPSQEAMDPTGTIVWRYYAKVGSNAFSPDGYCVVDACLDASGNGNPDALPLPPEMQDEELEVMVYVDRLDCIRMRAIGGYSRSQSIQKGIRSL